MTTSLRTFLSAARKSRKKSCWREAEKVSSQPRKMISCGRQINIIGGHRKQFSVGARKDDGEEQEKITAKIQKTFMVVAKKCILLKSKNGFWRPREILFLRPPKTNTSWRQKIVCGFHLLLFSRGRQKLFFVVVRE